MSCICLLMINSTLLDGGTLNGIEDNCLHDMTDRLVLPLERANVWLIGMMNDTFSKQLVYNSFSTFISAVNVSVLMVNLII